MPLNLEDFQSDVATFRRRAYPGEGEVDYLARIVGPLLAWEDRLPVDHGKVLGEALCDLCCLANARRLDLAFHARAALRRMLAEYEVSMGTPDDSGGEVYRGVLRQDWEESERGWGTRPDGYSLHLHEDDREAFIKAYWDSMPDHAPAEYSRPSGGVRQERVDAATYAELEASEHGIRRYR
jgi:hypothetical protein